jgi:HTH-type transcriptional regulator/antitoxin HipB
MDSSLPVSVPGRMIVESMRSSGNRRAGQARSTQQLGSAVRARRRALKLNQADLAALSGVGLAFLYELEHGKSTLRIDKVLAVLAVLGLELHVREGKEPLSVADALRRTTA